MNLYLLLSYLFQRCLSSNTYDSFIFNSVLYSSTYFPTFCKNSSKVIIFAYKLICQLFLLCLSKPCCLPTFMALLFLMCKIIPPFSKVSFWYRTSLCNSLSVFTTNTILPVYLKIEYRFVLHSSNLPMCFNYYYCFCSLLLYCPLEVQMHCNFWYVNVTIYVSNNRKILIPCSISILKLLFYKPWCCTMVILVS